jgi:hypothetical protein
MSRLALAVAFVASLTSSVSFAARAYVEPAAPRFAQPPHNVQLRQDPPSEGEPAPLDRASVRAALIQRRAANLAAFRAYRTAGVYPSNTFQDKSLNVWRDQDGHLCAAATMINASGETELVQRVGDQNNNLRLADVTTGPLMDWILTSGLTQAEIVAIQLPFMPVNEGPPSPQRRVAIDAGKRRAETQRLARRYAQTERTLRAQSRASLERAVDALMARPQLAWTIL